MGYSFHKWSLIKVRPDRQIDIFWRLQSLHRSLAGPKEVLNGNYWWENVLEKGGVVGLEGNVFLNFGQVGELKKKILRTFIMRRRRLLASEINDSVSGNADIFPYMSRRYWYEVKKKKKMLECGKMPVNGNGARLVNVYCGIREKNVSSVRGFIAWNVKRFCAHFL